MILRSWSGRSFWSEVNFQAKIYFEGSQWKFSQGREDKVFLLIYDNTNAWPEELISSHVKHLNYLS